jgi:hypothetical protein
MGIVDHDQRLEAVGQRPDVGQLGEIAVHREHPVGGDHDAPGAGRARRLELGFEVVHVAVGEAEAFRLAQPYAVDDRGVVEGVRNHRVVLAQQRLEQPAVGLEARGIEDRVFLPDISCDRPLEFAVEIGRAADEADRRHAEAVAVQRLLGRGDQARIVGEAEIVVGAQIENLARTAIDLDPHVAGLGRDDGPFGLPQVLRADRVEFGGNRGQEWGHGGFLHAGHAQPDTGEVAEAGAGEKPDLHAARLW